MLGGINYQTGTSYTFVATDVTRVTQFSNSSPVAATLPNGNTLGFQAGAIISAQNQGAGTVTVTCSGCTINGAGTFAIGSGSSVDLYSDGLNYVANKGSGSGGLAQAATINGIPGTLITDNSSNQLEFMAAPASDPNGIWFWYGNHIATANTSTFNYDRVIDANNPTTTSQDQKFQVSGAFQIQNRNLSSSNGYFECTPRITNNPCSSANNFYVGVTGSGAYGSFPAGFTDTLVLRGTHSPTSAANAAVAGEVTWDVNNLYVAAVGGTTGNAIWKTVPLGTSSGIVTAGLMAQYQLTEGSGTTLNDSSGNGNTATFSGGATNPTWVTGGLSFNGTSNYVLLPMALSTAKTVQVFASRGPFCDSGCTWTSNGTANWYPFIGTTGDPGSGTTHGLSISAFTNQWAGTAGGVSLIGNGSFNTATISGVNGNHLFTAVLDASTDHIYFDATEATYGAQHGSFGIQLASQQYTLGGYTTAGEGYSSTIYYYVLFYSTELTAQQVAQNYYSILSILQQRGVQTANAKPAQTNANNQLLLLGDSITAGLAGSTCCTVDTYTVSNFGLSGAGGQSFTNGSEDWRDEGVFAGAAGKNVFVYMIGTNEITGLSTAAAANTFWGYEVPVANARRRNGWRALTMTVPSKTSADTGKNLRNAAVRQFWTTAFDGFEDIAANPSLGADNAFSNPSGTYFNGDGVHLVANGDNLVSNLVARGIDRLWACKDFSCANTYTTTAAAATAITASSESGSAGNSTVTITSTLNPPLGSDVTITGVTPSGYNTSATNKCYVVTTSGSNFTCLNGTSGLGAGSVFGTAAIPMQKNQDVYVILGGSATSPSFTLQSCVGYTGQNFYFKQTNTTSNWVLTPFFTSETIDGATTLTMPTSSSGNNSVVVLQSQLVSGSAAGCTWKRLQ